VILYDSSMRLLGVSKRLLGLFGYESFDAFYADHTDVFGYFIEEAGFVRPSKGYVNVLLEHDGAALQVLIKSIDESIFIADISADEISTAKNGKIFQVSLHNLQERTAPEVIEPEPEPAPVVDEGPLEYVESKFINEFWIQRNANRLSFAQNDYYSFLDDFIKLARSNSEQLHESLISGNVEMSNSIISRLKDTAAALDVAPLNEILSQLDRANRQNVGQVFDNYQEIVNAIDKIVTKRKNK